MDGLYYMEELIASFVEEFELPDGKCERNAYRQRIRAAMERLGILGNYIEMTAPDSEYKRHYYSEQQRELVKNEPMFHDYLLKNSTNEQIKSGKRAQQIVDAIASRREECIGALGRRGYEEDGGWCVSSEELRQQKLSMMIEALFNRWFTGFDEEKLLGDMNLVLQEDELGLSPDQIRAEERLSHPEGAYYKRRSEDYEKPKP